MESSSACARSKAWLPGPMPSSHIARMTGSSEGKVWAGRGAATEKAAAARRMRLEVMGWFLRLRACLLQAVRMGQRLGKRQRPRRWRRYGRALMAAEQPVRWVPWAGRGDARSGTLPGDWRGVILTFPGSPSRPSLRRRIMTRARLPLPALALLALPALASLSAVPAHPQRFSIENVLSPGYPVQLVSARGGRPHRLDRVRGGEAQRVHGRRARLRAGAADALRGR